MWTCWVSRPKPPARPPAKALKNGTIPTTLFYSGVGIPTLVAVILLALLVQARARF